MGSWHRHPGRDVAKPTSLASDIDPKKPTLAERGIHQSFLLHRPDAQPPTMEQVAVQLARRIDLARVESNTPKFGLNGERAPKQLYEKRCSNLVGLM